MSSLGDKIQSKLVAMKVGVPTIPGVEKAIQTDEEAKEFARKCGYPDVYKRQGKILRSHDVIHRNIFITQSLSRFCDIRKVGAAVIHSRISRKSGKLRLAASGFTYAAHPLFYHLRQSTQKLITQRSDGSSHCYGLRIYIGAGLVI